VANNIDAPTLHGKEDLLLWDELAQSDDEDDHVGEEDEEDDTIIDYDSSAKERSMMTRFASAGANFESLLIHEDMLIHHQIEAPVTGLERVEDTRPYQLSPRARVRKRLMRSCDFVGLVSESRFMDNLGLNNLLTSLAEVISYSVHSEIRITGVSSEEPHQKEEVIYPLSPASEAMAEVLVCEIAIKNKDRLGSIWDATLKDHYTRRLTSLTTEEVTIPGEKLQTRPGIEKCVTGLLRISACGMARESVANELLGSLTLLYPSIANNLTFFPQLGGLDKYLGEGLWRICRNTESLSELKADGWEGLLGLAEWCAKRGGKSVVSIGTDDTPGLSDDDPALQAYRSIHRMLHAQELQNSVPFTVTQSINALIVSVAALSYAWLHWTYCMYCTIALKF
jgi:hypothetical protein